MVFLFPRFAGWGFFYMRLPPALPQPISSAPFPLSPLPFSFLGGVISFPLMLRRDLGIQTHEVVIYGVFALVFWFLFFVFFRLSDNISPFGGCDG